MNANGERVAEILRLADAMDVDRLIECFAADAVMELPFAAGIEQRYVGRDAILEFQRFGSGIFTEFSLTVDAIHETTNPRVVIAESHSNGVVRANGRPYNNRYITVFTFDDDGLLAGWREYYDTGEVVRAFGSSGPDET